MGADLYRNTTTNAERMEVERRANDLYRKYLDAGGENEHLRDQWIAAYDEKNSEEWYFRDSYNSSSLFWKLNLSWWQDLDQFIGPDGDGVYGAEDENGYSLYPIGIRKLAAVVRERSELLMYNCRDLPDDTGENGDLDKKYFSEKYDRFLKFLNDAAEAGDTIYCSV